MRKEICFHCGASMMTNSYTMNLTLLRALAKLMRSPGKPIREVGLSKSEYANVSKLKFWGFVDRIEDGAYRVTDDGRLFLGGHIRVPREITYFRNKKVSCSEDMIGVDQILKTEESKQKYREMMEPILMQDMR